MRNAEIARRANRTRNGRVTLTFQQAWYIRGTSSYYNNSTGGSGKIAQTFTSADYSGSGPYSITYNHGLGTQDYQWSVFKTENSAAIIVEYFEQQEDNLVLYFTGNTKDIRVIIFY